tara:strand:- start:1195 stop:1584 length:390 start_codon:yes stop_codon:yes gene_type:complete
MLAVRVLAFEDHYDIEALLSAGGVQVENLLIEQRWNSSDAVERIRTFAPDVLLLDHYMPPLSGYQVLEALLASDVKRPRTVIAMSSASEKNEAMVRLGANRGIVKFDLAGLTLWPKQTTLHRENNKNGA